MNETTPDWVLGVDFGDTHTAAAIHDPAGGVAELRLSDTGPVMASAVYREHDGGVLVGDRAIPAGLSDPERFAPYPKEAILSRDRWPLSDPAPVSSDIAAVLTDVAERACAVIGGSLPAIGVLAYPDLESVGFMNSYGAGLRAAAGLVVGPRWELVPASAAALTCFRRQQPRMDSPLILVINFGANDTDAVLYAHEPDGRYRAIAEETDDWGGGVFEVVVVEWLPDMNGRESLSLRDILDRASGLRFRVRDAIAVLTDRTSVELAIERDTTRAVVTLTRDRFDYLAREYIGAAVELTKNMLRVAEEHGASSNDTTIILTGSAALNPTIRARIAELGVVAELGDPRTIIARGAAYYGALPDADRPEDTSEPAVSFEPAPPRSGQPVVGVSGLGGRIRRRWDEPDELGSAFIDEMPSASHEYDVDGAFFPGGVGEAGSVDGGGYGGQVDYDWPAPGHGYPQERSEAERPPSTGPSGRHLLAEVTHNTEPCTKALASNRNYELTVWIGVPRAGEEGVLFDESKVRGRDYVELVVDVSSKDNAIHGRDTLLLPLYDRTQDSTPAAIEFQTGGTGLLQLYITVLYEGRPIQSAVLVAPVRAKPNLRDRIRLLPRQLSSDSEPHKDVTKADVTLEDTGATLKQLGTFGPPPEISLGELKPVTDALIATASDGLGTPSAPESWDDPNAIALLIDLARIGQELADRLERFDLGDARTIAIMVQPDSAIIPLELVYDGEPPEQNARLCGCIVGQKPPPAHGTTHASAGTVCPYAFWGMNRVIARTIARQPVRRRKVHRPQIAPLSLRPILYGAAAKVDELSPATSPLSNAIHSLDGVAAKVAKLSPSEDLGLALQKRAGQCERVTSWRSWSAAVKRAKPQMLVVLGHTETPKYEMRLVIGKNSTLWQKEVRLKYLGALDTPAPLVLLLACSTAAPNEVFGALSATFVDQGAAAVIASLTRLRGSHGAIAAKAVVNALHSSHTQQQLKLAAALNSARKQLLEDGLLIGLLLVAHGEIDLELAPPV